MLLPVSLSEVILGEAVTLLAEVVDGSRGNEFIVHTVLCGCLALAYLDRDDLGSGAGEAGRQAGEDVLVGNVIT